MAYDQETGFGLVQALGQASTSPCIELGDSAAARPGDPSCSPPPAAAGTRSPPRSPAARNSPAIGNTCWTTRSSPLPAHPFWGGAALIGKDGKLLGIGSLVLQQGGEGRRQDMNMVVPVELLPPILDELLSLRPRHRPARPWLGLYAMEDDEALVVGGLADNGPADKAGVRAGDRILAVNGAEVPDLAGLWRAVWASGPAGCAVQVSVGRGNRNTSVTIPTTDRASILKTPRLH